MHLIILNRHSDEIIYIQNQTSQIRGQSHRHEVVEEVPLLHPVPFAQPLHRPLPLPRHPHGQAGRHAGQKVSRAAAQWRIFKDQSLAKLQMPSYAVQAEKNCDLQQGLYSILQSWALSVFVNFFYNEK